MIEAAQLETMWGLVLNHVSQSVGRGNIESLFSHTRLLSVSRDKAVVSVPNQFLGDMVSGQYYNYFMGAMRQVLGVSLGRIQLTVDDVIEESKPINSPNIENGGILKKAPSGLNPSHTFSSFVVGAGSRFAHAASVRVAETPGKAYNPLFIYGDVGLGKTHLLSSIGNAIYDYNPNLQVVYVTSEHFTNDVIASIRYQKMDEFRKRYRKIDVLLVDDIQFISGKEVTQEEFFHTFNALYKEGRQVVFSADRSAKEISGIDERLRSRFEMGLVADIQPPDLETKIAILYKKAEAERISLPEEVANFIARCVRSNVRELEGSLIRLGAYSSLVGHEITLESAQHVLKDIVPQKKQEIYISDVQQVVAEHFHVRGGDLKSKRRTKQVVVPRQVAMYLCRELTKASFPEIGSAFGGKDHSTVIHACKQIEKIAESDAPLKETLELLTKTLEMGRG